MMNGERRRRHPGIRDIWMYYVGGWQSSMIIRVVCINYLIFSRMPLAPSAHAHGIRLH